MTADVGERLYHQPEMKITYLFLPVYFGLFAGLVAHSVKVGLAGLIVGLFLAMLAGAREAPRRRHGSD